MSVCFNFHAHGSPDPIGYDEKKLRYYSGLLERLYAIEHGTPWNDWYPLYRRIYEKRNHAFCLGLELSISNATARTLGALLEIHDLHADVLAGQLDIDSFIRKTFVLMNDVPSQEIPTVEEKGPARIARDENGTPRISTGPTMIHVGREEGHFQHLSARLNELAVKAKTLGANHVSWA